MSPLSTHQPNQFPSAYFYPPDEEEKEEEPQAFFSSDQEMEDLLKAPPQ